ncbi:Lipoprotein-anchoring transpeptidase ErfK/SrfK [Paracoccus alcaliphilus]|uniref:Lipoprotein-anchoring transpeptidase ErfK/SrfK n=1 Tax=Paracoccus alcaliphilus TaxID=34002 RepID=A0A1H8FG49_9RHOB|nr:L,D-transpeptidase [Paracoccus alcaliphilus]WCR19294.1 L,D-transpeptidase [Paracoccus alcaliphilus]SEN30606.1 Lipoprotein-anchoring transpeptidase ErfK/SrfK [Paracoccus alcaliphilus]
MSDKPALNRRAFLGSAAALGAAGLAMPALAQQYQYDANAAQPFAAPAPAPMPASNTGPQHNISSFRMQDWRPHFSNLTNGAILCDLTSRAVHFWSEDESVYRVYPSSIPVSDDLTRTGRTEIIRRVEGPSWAPTPEMKKRNPEWPDFVPPGDPDNPMGTHALWFSWQYYRLHGTHDTRKIGRKSSNGCIGLYNEHIKEMYELAKIGTQVLVL